jgi:hypothetical protein
MRLNRRSFLGGLLALPAVAKLVGRQNSAPPMFEVGEMTRIKETPIIRRDHPILAGQLVYMREDGQWAPCDANTPSLHVSGIALSSGNGREVRVMPALSSWSL